MLGRIQLQGEPGIGQAPTRCRAELSLCHCCSRAAPVLCSQCCAGLLCLHSCSQSFLLFLPVRLVLDRLLTKIPGKFLKDDVDTDKGIQLLQWNRGRLPERGETTLGLRFPGS